MPKSTDFNSLNKAFLKKIQAKINARSSEERSEDSKYYFFTTISIIQPQREHVPTSCGCLYITKSLDLNLSW